MSARCLSLTGWPPLPLLALSMVARHSAYAWATVPGLPVALRPQRPYWWSSPAEWARIPCHRPWARASAPCSWIWWLLRSSHQGPGSHGLLHGRARSQNTTACCFHTCSGGVSNSQVHPEFSWVLQTQSLAPLTGLPQHDSQPGLGGQAQKSSAWWCYRNQYLRNQAPHLESWRTQVYYAGGPRGVNIPSSEPPQRGYRVLIHRQAWLSGFVGLQGLGDCKQQDKGEWDISSSS